MLLHSKIGAAMFMSETLSEMDGDVMSRADAHVEKCLQDWIDAGEEPAALLNAMAEILDEIVTEVAIPAAIQ